MLNVSTEAAAKELREYKIELERRLTNMVAGFAYEVTEAASANTPRGNAEDLEIGLDFFRMGGNGLKLPPEARYAWSYITRFQRTGIQPEVGYHQGAWVYSPSGSPISDPTIKDPSDASSDVNLGVLSTYKVGEKFYIVGKGPAFNLFEAGVNPQAVDGILGPTIEDIQVTYSADLYRYFNQN